MTCLICSSSTVRLKTVKCYTHFCTVGCGHFNVIKQAQVGLHVVIQYPSVPR